MPPTPAERRVLAPPSRQRRRRRGRGPWRRSRRSRGSRRRCPRRPPGRSRPLVPPAPAEKPVPRPWPSRPPVLAFAPALGGRLLRRRRRRGLLRHLDRRDAYGLRRPVARVRVDPLEPVHHVHPLAELTENGVLAVEPRARIGGDD